MTESLPYRCISSDCGHAPLRSDVDGLRCPNGHHFAFAPGTDIPVFDCEDDDVNEYAGRDAAQMHDNALRWLFATFRDSEDALRTRLISRLGLAGNETVLITGAGAGNDLPFMALALNDGGTIFVQDYARPMLLAGAERHREALARAGIEAHFSVSDAANLPFPDGYFDAAYHFGGINLFADVARGIHEMSRVVAVGGRVVIGDEGVAPWLTHTDFARMLVTNNALYACEVPLRHLPVTAHSVNVSWELCNCFYVIEFTVGATAPLIDIDVPHVGVRGGSIRTRYFGRLEGINPELRERIYAEAERLGMSRVEYLESIVAAGLDDA